MLVRATLYSYKSYNYYFICLCVYVCVCVVSAELHFENKTRKMCAVYERWRERCRVSVTVFLLKIFICILGDVYEKNILFYILFLCRVITFYRHGLNWVFSEHDFNVRSRLDSLIFKLAYFHIIRKLELINYYNYYIIS